MRKETFLQVFGSKGNGDGQFTYPHGVVVGQQGYYIVADHNNHRIQIFNSQGQFVRKFGSNENIVVTGVVTDCRSLILRAILFESWVLDNL